MLQLQTLTVVGGRGNPNHSTWNCPNLAQKFSAIETKTSKVLDDVGEVTQKVKENPSVLLRRPKEPKETAKRGGR